LLALSAPPAGRWPPPRLAEAAGLFVTFAVLYLVVFDDDFLFSARELPVAFLPFPALVWAALRFGAWGATGSVVVLAAMAAWGTAHGEGPFALHNLQTGLTLYWSFLATAVVLALLITALQAERDQVEVERERLFAVSLDFLCVGDREGRIRRINPAV